MLTQTDFLTDDSPRTRSSRVKLRCRQLQLNYTKFFFTSDVVREWSKLPLYVVLCNTINVFKIKLDHHVSNKVSDKGYMTRRTAGCLTRLLLTTITFDCVCPDKDRPGLNPRLYLV